MNKFDKVFFKKYIPDGSQIKEIIHQHIILIIDKIILNYFFFVILPTFIYFYSDKVKELIPFFVLEGFLIIMFIRILYQIFDWYCDVWIVTDEWVVELDWSLFSANAISVKYSSIEWLEVEQDWIIDTLLNKWSLIIHKIWWSGDSFRLDEASKPYEAIDIIEKYWKWLISKWNEEENKSSVWDDYEIIINSLSEVVKSYIEKNNFEKKKETDYIEEVKEKPWTIDIR